MQPTLEYDHHMIQDLDIAFSFRHFTPIWVEKER